MSNPYQSPQSDTELPRPLWVKVGLWGLPSRGSALAFMWLSLLIAIGSGIYAFQDPRAAVGLVMVFAALWYWLALRWVDQYGRW